MFFSGYFNSVATIVDARLKGYERDRMNPADKGELCEVFMKEFLEDSLGDNFRIFRGGKIINVAGVESKQLDIVLCSKRTIKIFSDKGIYPTETVKGVFSITATLDKLKLTKCMEELASIPKTGYHFIGQQIFPEKFRIQTQRVFEDLTPVTCIFAYRGDIDQTWASFIQQWVLETKPHHSLTPDLVIVNNKGMIIKQVTKTGENRASFSWHFIDFSITNHPGEAFSRIVHDLYNLSNEELYLQPDYTKYFNRDLGA
jgi:hypothetical protein